MKLLTTLAEESRERSLLDRFKAAGGEDVLERWERAGFTLPQLQRLDLAFRRGTLSAQLRELDAATSPDDPAQLLRRAARALPLVPFTVNGHLAGLEDQVASGLMAAAAGLDRLRRLIPTETKGGRPHGALRFFSEEWLALTRDREKGDRHYDLGAVACTAILGTKVKGDRLAAECRARRREENTGGNLPK